MNGSTWFQCCSPQWNENFSLTFTNQYIYNSLSYFHLKKWNKYNRQRDREREYLLQMNDDNCDKMNEI